MLLMIRNLLRLIQGVILLLVATSLAKIQQHLLVFSAMYFGVGSFVGRMLLLVLR